MNAKKIVLHPYNPDWPYTAQVEIDNIKKILGPRCVEIHHIGSTSIPGLMAKEDLDILCVVDSLNSSRVLSEHGFVFKGELNIPLRYFFSKNSERSKVNIHVVETGHGFIKWNLTFRDYLREHQDERDAYAALKQRIVKDESSIERVQNMMPRYAHDKSDFICSILAKAAFDDVTFYFCFHKTEWETYNRILGNEQKDIEFKCLSASLSSPREFNFIMKKGTEVVAAALVKLIDSTPVTRKLAAANLHEGKGYEQQLARVIEFTFLTKK